MVLVEWVDSMGGQGWCDKEDVADLEPCTCLTVGFLLREEPTHITLVQSQTGGMVDNYITIPKRSITARANLERS